MVVLAGEAAGDPTTGLTTWSSLLVLPAAPRRDGGDPALMDSSFVAQDPPGIFGLCVQVRW